MELYCLCIVAGSGVIRGSILWIDEESAESYVTECFTEFQG